MAVPVHLFLTDDGGAMIRGSCDVMDREGSIELRGLHHCLTIPTDPMTGKLTGTRQHLPFQFTKELDSASPYLFKAAATGQTLKSAEFRFYNINYAGQEVEYYRITLESDFSQPCYARHTRLSGNGPHGRGGAELREDYSSV
jgi:type VI secretion system secreted protein Hcp